MTEQEARALGELLRDLEQRVNRLQEAMELRIESSIGQEWLSVGERLALLGDERD
ncbi:MAG TPA: hypothetical protein VNM14_08390 [Planctomycetota bacterium]|nr:hypothetical protein [Planctomycetota bacterium]